MKYYIEKSVMNLGWLMVTPKPITWKDEAIARCKEIQNETGHPHRVVDENCAVVYCQPVGTPPMSIYPDKSRPAVWDKIEAGGEIDMTPTWVDVLPIHFAALEHGNEKGKKAAKKEILRLAQCVDKINEVRKSEIVTSPVADMIFQNVTDAMQEAEELSAGLSIPEYIGLMRRIVREGEQRLRAALANKPEGE